MVFRFNRRFLVYFAVDHTDVYMTTKLDGKTYFLPFNQGSNGPGRVGGAGNPSNKDGYPTAYLWEKVLTRDNLMDIIQRFMNLEIKKKSKATESHKENVDFSSLSSVRCGSKIGCRCKSHGSGENYLIQHSAGSGKSNSIAWLAYHLASIHDQLNYPIFHQLLL